MKSIASLGLFAGLFLTTQLYAQVPASPPDDSPDRTEQVEPFHIIDNIYFVGTTVQSTSYLITGSAGHILIDPTYEESVTGILERVEKLGFKPRDIKLIIGTHAHSDHVAGLSLMQEMTGGDILASAEDKQVIESGGAADFREGSWSPAEVDRVISHGETITLGDITLTAHHTPGHTKGCMTFTMKADADGKQYDVIFLGGVRMAAQPLLGHPKYPGMAEDLATSFVRLKKLPVDIYLGGHGYWFDLSGKIAKLKQGGDYHIFIDPEGYRRAIDGWQQQYIDRLVDEGMALAR